MPDYAEMERLAIAAQEAALPQPPAVERYDRDFQWLLRKGETMCLWDDDGWRDGITRRAVAAGVKVAFTYRESSEGVREQRASVVLDSRTWREYLAVLAHEGHENT
jgi:hypothetical protein